MSLRLPPKVRERMRPMGRSVIARCGGAGGGTISQRRSCDDQRRSIRRQGLLPLSSLARINGNHDGVVTASASGSDAVVMMCLGGGRRGALGMDNANEMNNWLDVSGDHEFSSLDLLTFGDLEEASMADYFGAVARDHGSGANNVDDAERVGVDFHTADDVRQAMGIDDEGQDEVKPNDVVVEENQSVGNDVVETSGNVAKVKQDDDCDIEIVFVGRASLANSDAVPMKTEDARGASFARMENTLDATPNAADPPSLVHAIENATVCAIDSVTKIEDIGNPIISGATEDVLPDDNDVHGVKDANDDLLAESPPLPRRRLATIEAPTMMQLHLPSPKIAALASAATTLLPAASSSSAPPPPLPPLPALDIPSAESPHESVVRSKPNEMSFNTTLLSASREVTSIPPLQFREDGESHDRAMGANDDVDNHPECVASVSSSSSPPSSPGNQTSVNIGGAQYRLVLPAPLSETGNNKNAFDAFIAAPLRAVTPCNTAPLLAVTPCNAASAATTNATIGSSPVRATSPTVSLSSALAPAFSLPAASAFASCATDTGNDVEKASLRPSSPSATKVGSVESSVTEKPELNAATWGHPIDGWKLKRIETLMNSKTLRKLAKRKNSSSANNYINYSYIAADNKNDDASNNSGNKNRVVFSSKKAREIFSSGYLPGDDKQIFIAFPDYVKDSHDAADASPVSSSSGEKKEFKFVFKTKIITTAAKKNKVPKHRLRKCGEGPSPPKMFSKAAVQRNVLYMKNGDKLGYKKMKKMSSCPKMGRCCNCPLKNNQSICHPDIVVAPKEVK